MKHKLTSIAIIVLALTSCASGRVSDPEPEECPIQKIYADPIASMGSEINSEGRIVSVMKVSLPVGLLLETGGRLWYAELYRPESAAPGTVRDGNRVMITGRHIGTRKIMHRGAYLELPLIMAESISLR